MAVDDGQQVQRSARSSVPVLAGRGADWKRTTPLRPRVAWSSELLDEAEKQLLEQVFGVCTK